MKKLFTLLLSVAMIATMSVSAFAADAPTGGSKDVIANYEPGKVSDTVYQVDIQWGSLEFTYTDASEGTWDPSTHTYVDATEAGWTCADGANVIAVTNHSNGAVDVAVAESDVAEGITFQWNKKSFELATADNGADGAAGTPTSDSVELTVSGELAEAEGDIKIGTVTLTITAK